MVIYKKAATFVCCFWFTQKPWLSSMFATLFRLFGYILLAGGVIVAIVDATRSVAANALQFTSLGETLQAYAPGMANWLIGAKESLNGAEISNWPLSNVIDYINAVPVAPLAAGLFLLIYGVASRNRAPRHF
jgi:hypothetical protein